MIFKSKKKPFVENQKIHGLNDLLSFLMLVDEQTILHKDGALSQHFCYQAPDLESSIDSELDFHSITWQRALGFLGDGWMVETNVVTRPFQPKSPCQSFPEIVSALLDDERSLHFQSGLYFTTHYYLSITWKPADWVESHLPQFVWTQEQPKTSKTEFELRMANFKAKVNEFMGYLSRAVKLTELKSQALISFLHHCITGLPQQLVAPYEGAFLDTYLSSQDFVGGFSPEIGVNKIKVLAIDDLPPESYPMILNTLTILPLSYRWSTRFIPLDPLTAKAYLKRYERNWSSKAIGFLGVLRESLGMPAKLDRDAEQTAETIRQAAVANSSGTLQYGFYNSVLVLMHEEADSLKKMAEVITNHIQQLNFRVRTEWVNATEAFLGSIPCHGDYNLRKMLVDTHFVSHALPISQSYPGESRAPCPYYE